MTPAIATAPFGATGITVTRVFAPAAGRLAFYQGVL